VPNLFSKTAFDCVAIVDPGRHVLFPSQLAGEALADAIRVSRDLLRRARSRDPRLIHHVVGMNFLPPGGSSVPHPHFQVHVRGVPYSGVTRLARLGEDFRAAAGRGYWGALLERERELGARWVGESGEVAWLAAFAPTHQKELWGVLRGAASLVEVGEREAQAFGEGIAKVLAFYEESGLHAFTFAFLSSPEPGDADRLALQLRVCARPAPKALYANYDTWFTPLFLGEDVQLEPPEAYAARLRERW